MSSVTLKILAVARRVKNAEAATSVKTQMHIDPLLERPVGVFWAENSQQVSQEENICELF